MADLLPQIPVFLIVPGFLQGCLVQVRQLRHLIVVAAADAHSSVGHNPHVGVGHEAGLLDDLLGALLVGSTARFVSTSWR